MYKGDTAPLGAPTGTLAAFSGSAGKEDDKARGAALAAGNRRSPLHTDTIISQGKHYNSAGEAEFPAG